MALCKRPIFKVSSWSCPQAVLGGWRLSCLQEVKSADRSVLTASSRTKILFFTEYWYYTMALSKTRNHREIWNVGNLWQKNNLIKIKIPLKCVTSRVLAATVLSNRTFDLQKKWLDSRSTCYAENATKIEFRELIKLNKPKFNIFLLKEFWQNMVILVSVFLHTHGTYSNRKKLC
jgi:hypothetical protein